MRMGIDHGRPTLTDTGYVGLSVNTVARVCAAGHGGQIVVSDRVRESTQGSLPAGVRLRSLGTHHLRGLTGEHRLHELQAKGLPSGFPKLRTAKP